MCLLSKPALVVESSSQDYRITKADSQETSLQGCVRDTSLAHREERSVSSSHDRCSNARFSLERSDEEIRPGGVPALSDDIVGTLLMELLAHPALRLKTSEPERTYRSEPALEPREFSRRSRDLPKRIFVDSF